MTSQERAILNVYKTGAHSLRSPLSYPALWPLFERDITLVDRPEAADLYLFAHSLDIRAAPQALVADWRKRRRPVVLLSEEPFWDTIWTRRPLEREIVIESDWGALPVIQLTYGTSAVFETGMIPYYLLSNHRFANAYRARFARNAARTPEDWRKAFASRAVDVSFMFERRPEPHHNLRWPAGGIIGLCAWRTELAEATASTPLTSERLGQSWQGGATRFELANWHLDKLIRLDGHARMIAAFENTHQPGYLSEKFFDAFACGALPLYFAAPDHAVHRLGLPPQSWANFHDLSPQAALAALCDMTWDSARFEAYAAAQSRLNALFNETAHLVTARQRLRDALLSALRATLDNAHPGVSCR